VVDSHRHLHRHARHHAADLQAAQRRRYEITGVGATQTIGGGITRAFDFDLASGLRRGWSRLFPRLEGRIAHRGQRRRQ